jgi:CheY-like chemotaxis protein
MARILIAASPKPRETIERALAGHDLACVATMSKAERILRNETFDLIICTVLFDESRMLDLLRFAKSRPQSRAIPFACVRARTQVLANAIAVEAVDIASRALGAATFINVPAYRVNPERELRNEIEQLLGA